MTKDEVAQIWEMVERVLLSSTKADAEPTLNKLRFKASTLSHDIDPYLRGKFSEVVAYASEAAGNVKLKDHWISVTKNSWAVFESGILK